MRSKKSDPAAASSLDPHTPQSLSAGSRRLQPPGVPLLRDTQRGPIVLSLAALVVTLALFPFGGHHLGPTTSYVPAVLAVVACFDVMSMWLLAGEYTDTGDRRMLAMAIAYLWSLILMGSYALAFPGVISSHPPIAVTPSVAPYLYLGWHAGFPLLLGAAWAPWPGLDRAD